MANEQSNAGASDLPLKNTGSERLGSATDASTIFENIKDAEFQRDDADSRIKGMVDMNRPYSVDKLKKLGRSWECNINWGDGRSAIQQGLAPYYDLFSSSKHHIEVETGMGDESERIVFSTIITEEIDSFLKETSILEDEAVADDTWDGFDFNMQQMLFSLITYGKGHLFWEGKSDWRFKWIDKFKVRVPDGTSSGLSKLEVLTVEEKLPIHALAHMAKTGSTMGWDQAAVMRSIKRAAPNDVLPEEPHEYQEALNALELAVEMRTNKVPIAHVYIKETDGQISHYIIETERSQSSEQSYLLRLHKHFKSWRKVFSPFFIESMDGTWNGSSGLGKMIYGPMEVKNRLQCRQANLGFLRSGVNLKARTPNAVADNPLIMGGGVNIWHSNFNLERANVIGDMEGMLELDRAIEDRISNNIGVYRTQVNQPKGNPRTAEEVRLQFSNQALLGNSQVNRFYGQLDRFYRELVRRLIKDKKLRKRIKDREVPLKALDNLTKVVAMRTVGNGSPHMRQQSILQQTDLIPYMPESGRYRFVQDASAALGSHTLSSRYFPDLDPAETASEHHWQASVENSQMRLGQRPLIVDEQNHVIHLQSHFASWAEGLESVQQGGDVEEIWSFGEAAGPHTAEHLTKIEGNETRTDAFKALKAQWSRFSQLHEELTRQITKNREQAQQAKASQQQAQSIQNGTDPEIQIDAAKARRSMELKEVKQAQQMRHSEEEHQQKLRQTV